MDREARIVRMTRRQKKLNAELKELREESRCNQLLESILAELKRSNELQEQTNKFLELLVGGLTNYDLKGPKGEAQ